jgi:phosphomannomutase
MSNTNDNAAIPKICKILLATAPGQSFPNKQLEGLSEEVVRFELDKVSADRTFNFLILKSAIDYAKEHEIDLIIAVDPEFDRLSLVVRKGLGGAFMVLNSHQVAAVLLKLWMDTGLYPQMKVLKSVLLSDILDNIAKRGSLELEEQILVANNLKSGVEKFRNSADETIAAFNIDQQVLHSDLKFHDIVRQLIGMESALLDEQKNIYNFLLDIYFYNGFFKEKTVTLDLSVEAHQDQVVKFMKEAARKPKFLEEILSVSAVTDYSKGKKKNILTDKVYDHPISGANILKIETVEGVSITLVPTEDKLTYYISVRESVNTPERFETANKALDQEIFKLVSLLNKMI